MAKLSNETIKLTKRILKERNEKPEQVNEILGGLKRLLGKPGSPEDQAVLDYIANMPISGFPELASLVKQLSRPNQIKRGIKGELNYRSQGESAAFADRRKVSVRNAEKQLPRIVQQLERLQSDAQGKMFKGTAGLMMRLIQGYRDTILSDEEQRKKDQFAQTSRETAKADAAARGRDRSALMKTRRGL